MSRLYWDSGVPGKYGCCAWTRKGKHGEPGPCGGPCFDGTRFCYAHRLLTKPGAYERWFRQRLREHGVTAEGMDTIVADLKLLGLRQRDRGN